MTTMRKNLHFKLSYEKRRDGTGKNRGLKKVEVVKVLGN
jgi:hypothetical protein